MMTKKKVIDKKSVPKKAKVTVADLSTELESYKKLMSDKLAGMVVATRRERNRMDLLVQTLLGAFNNRRLRKVTMVNGYDCDGDRCVGVYAIKNLLVNKIDP